MRLTTGFGRCRSQWVKEVFSNQLERKAEIPEGVGGGGVEWSWNSEGIGGGGRG